MKIEKIYTPDSVLRTPHLFFSEMAEDIRASREIAWRLLVRNMRARYRQTMLGYAWAFLPALATTLVWVFLHSQKVFQTGPLSIPYPVHVMVGTLLWQVFTDAVRSPMEMMDATKLMLTKIRFPHEAIILAGMGQVLVNFGVRLVLLFGVLAWFKVPIAATAALMPLGILALLMLGTTLGVLLVPFGVLYRDTVYGLAVALQLWFYVTPIIYPLPSSGPAAALVRINPVALTLETTRSWLVGSGTADVASFLLIAAGGGLVLFLGWCFYRVALPHIVERIGA